MGGGLWRSIQSPAGPPGGHGRWEARKEYRPFLPEVTWQSAASVQQALRKDRLMVFNAILLGVLTVLVLTLIALLRRTYDLVPAPVPEETVNVTPYTPSFRPCPLCGTQIPQSAHKCFKCKAVVGLCPACRTDAIFGPPEKRDKRYLNVKCGLGNLGWPLTTIATCKSCGTALLVCGYCASPMPTGSPTCRNPECGAPAAVGLLPMADRVGDIIGGVFRGKGIPRSKKP